MTHLNKLYQTALEQLKKIDTILQRIKQDPHEGHHTNRAATPGNHTFRAKETHFHGTSEQTSKLSVRKQVNEYQTSNNTLNTVTEMEEVVLKARKTFQDITHALTTQGNIKHTELDPALEKLCNKIHKKLTICMDSVQQTSVGNKIKEHCQTLRSTLEALPFVHHNPALGVRKRT